MVEDPNWGRLELLKRRLVHRAGGATWLPPEDFGPSAIKSARFSLCNCALWLTLALVSWVMESLVADSPADEDRMVLFARLICRTSTYSSPQTPPVSPRPKSHPLIVSVQPARSRSNKSRC